MADSKLKIPVSKSTLMLVVGFGVLLIAFSYLSFYSFNQFSQINNTLSQTTNNNDIQMSSALEMRVAVRERAILLWHMTLLEDAFDRDELFEKFYDYGSGYQASRQKYLDSILTESEKNYLVNLDKETSSRAPLLREFANNLMDDEQRDLYNDNLNQVLTDQIIVANILDEIIRLQQDQNGIARTQAAELIADVLFQLITWTILILISGIFFARKVVQSSIGKNRLLKKANDDLERLARYDHLTGLPNRLFLLEHLELALPLATRNEYKCALFFIDLDGFKAINDTYGHEAGDEFLKKIGNRMKRVLRESDVLARLGGDEFVIVLFDIPDNSQALTVAEKLLLILADKYVVNGNEVNASASIGVCFFPEKQMNVEKLICRADSAMYKAKELGKNRYYVSNPKSVKALGSVVK
jgi:diguanylate cyclase (GGDEF)-like protein